jgi:23S rRNA pseudouridine2457 synthase
MPRYLLFNKPYLVLPSFTDPDYERGEIDAPRAALADYVSVEGVYPAGRLDYDSEGLLFLTDDGALAHRMTHPTFFHPKTYLVQVEGIPDESALNTLRRGGIPIKEYHTAPAQARLLDSDPDLWPRDPPIRERASIPTAWLELTLTEGKKRQVRRMTAAVGYPTLRLVRVAIGPLRLDDLQPGQWRDATPNEISAVHAMLRQSEQARKPARKKYKR